MEDLSSSAAELIAPQDTEFGAKVALLGALTIALGTALASAKWFGVSLALGAFIAGFTVSLSLQATPQAIRSFMVGFAGGVTTYSAFALESVRIYDRGDLGITLAYIAISVTLYVLASAVGFLLADYLEGPW